MATTCSVHVGDTVEITLTLVDCSNSVLSLAGATTQQIIVRSATTRVAKDSSFVTDGTDGKISAVFESTDITESGLWQVQGYVVLPGSRAYHTEVETFNVSDNL